MKHASLEKNQTDQKKKVAIKTVKKIRYKGIHAYNMLLPILSIIIVAMIILFFVFNAEHKTSVYLIFKTFRDVPVAAVIVFSFLAGTIFMLGVTFRQIRKKKKIIKELQSKENKKEEERISKIEDKNSQGTI